MNIIYKQISELIPYVNNPRKNEKAVDAVASSIKNYGFRQPIVIDAKNEIIIGHTRLLAAKKLKMESVPCAIADDLTPQQIKGLRIADNKVGEIAEWDIDLLKIELEGLEEFTGFDIDELNMMFEEEKEITEDEVPEIQEKVITNLGDLYEIGDHRLLCGDSTDSEQVAKLMNGKKADMVFTDPPWNVNYCDVKKGNAMGYKPRIIMNDSMSTNDFKDFMVSAFAMMAMHSKKGCPTYVVMSAQEWGNFMIALHENNYHWSSTIIWNKSHFVMSRKDYHTKYEPIWYGWLDGAQRLCPVKDRKQSDVWDVDRPTKSELHPTTKPIMLISIALKNSSKMGNLVFELFTGSGSTMVACHQLNRICYGMELDPKYCDVIIRRMMNLDPDITIKRNGIDCKQEFIG